MNKEFNWLVFDDECLVAGFVSRDDAEQFIEQCGCDTMKTAAASANRVRSGRKRSKPRRQTLKPRPRV
jgi:hypothetical protein